MLSNIFKKIFSKTSENREQGPSSAKRSPLLELPPELILYITDFLESGADKICLASTCRTLRGSLVYPISSFPLAQKQDAAHQLQLDWLDRWHCGLCYRFHSVHLHDTPANPTAVENECSASWKKQELYTALGSYQLANRHITQALKYTAALGGERGTTLSDTQSAHLSRLLAPHHTAAFLSYSSYADFFVKNGKMESDVQYWHSVFPKIVQGRFLLMSLWIYRGTSERVHEHRDFCICKHQFVYQSRERLDQNEYFNTPRKRRVSCIDDLKDTRISLHPRNSEYWFSLLFNVEQRALHSEGTEVCGSCPFCPTDFAVKRYSAGRLVYCSWQDMGSLAISEGNSARKVFAWEHTGPDRVWHPEGSIRALYHSCGDDSIRYNMGLSSNLPPKFDLEQMAIELEEFGPKFSARYKPLLSQPRWRITEVDKSYTRLAKHQDSWRCWIENPTGSHPTGAEHILPVADESKIYGSDKDTWLANHGMSVGTKGPLPRQQSLDNEVSIQLGKHSSGQGAVLDYLNEDNPGGDIPSYMKRGTDIEASIEGSISILASFEENLQSGMIYDEKKTHRILRARAIVNRLRPHTRKHMRRLRELDEEFEEDGALSMAEQEFKSLNRINDLMKYLVKFLSH